MYLIDKYINHVHIDISSYILYVQIYTVRYCMSVLLSEYIAGGVMIIEMKGDKHI